MHFTHEEMPYLGIVVFIFVMSTHIDYHTVSTAHWEGRITCGRR